jgi:hypothetical protein
MPSIFLNKFTECKNKPNKYLLFDDQIIRPFDSTYFSNLLLFVAQRQVLLLSVNMGWMEVMMFNLHMAMGYQQIQLANDSPLVLK